MPLTESPIEELEYDHYQERQRLEIGAEGLESRIAKLRIGNRAAWNGHSWTPQPYPGFALQAMVAASSENNPLIIDLAEIQNRILKLVPRPGVLYGLPKASFHQTVANTFSADRLQKHVIDAGLQDTFPEIIAQSLQDLTPSVIGRPLIMDMIGVGVFRTAIGLLGVFSDPSSFQRIVHFRDQFYSHPELEKIGLKRTRPFIGHITLAYVEAELNGSEQRDLADGLVDLNTDIADASIKFHMPAATLHRYDTLADFIPNPSYPSYTL